MAQSRRPSAACIQIDIGTSKSPGGFSQQTSGKRRPVDEWSDFGSAWQEAAPTSAGRALKAVVGLLGLDVHDEARVLSSERWLLAQEPGGMLHPADCHHQGDKAGHGSELGWQLDVLKHLRKHLGGDEVVGFGADGKDEVEPDMQERLGVAERMLRRISRCVSLLQTGSDDRDVSTLLRRVNQDAILDVSEDMQRWLEQLAVLISVYHVHIIDLQAERARLMAASGEARQEAADAREVHKDAARRHDVVKRQLKNVHMQHGADRLLGKGEKVYSQKQLEEILDQARKDWEEEFLDPLKTLCDDLRAERDGLKAQMAEREKRAAERLLQARREPPTNALAGSGLRLIRQSFSAMGRHLPDSDLRAIVERLDAALEAGGSGDSPDFAKAVEELENHPVKEELENHPVKDERLADEQLMDVGHVSAVASALAAVTTELQVLGEKLGRSGEDNAQISGLVTWANQTLSQASDSMVKRLTAAEKVKKVAKVAAFSAKLRGGLAFAKQASRDGGEGGPEASLLVPPTSRDVDMDSKDAEEELLEEIRAASPQLHAERRPSVSEAAASATTVQEARETASAAPGETPVRPSRSKGGGAGGVASPPARAAYDATRTQAVSSGLDADEPLKDSASSLASSKSLVESVLFKWSRAPKWDLSTRVKKDVAVNTTPSYEQGGESQKSSAAGGEWEKRMAELRQELEAKLAAAMAEWAAEKRRLEEELLLMQTERDEALKANAALKAKLEEVERALLTDGPNAKELLQELKGLSKRSHDVFERLYEDALVRIKRLAEIQDRILRKAVGSMSSAIKDFGFEAISAQASTFLDVDASLPGGSSIEAGPSWVSDWRAHQSHSRSPTPRQSASPRARQRAHQLQGSQAGEASPHTNQQAGADVRKANVFDFQPLQLNPGLLKRGPSPLRRLLDDRPDSPETLQWRPARRPSQRRSCNPQGPDSRDPRSRSASPTGLGARTPSRPSSPPRPQARAGTAPGRGAGERTDLLASARPSRIEFPACPDRRKFSSGLQPDCASIPVGDEKPRTADQPRSSELAPLQRPGSQGAMKRPGSQSRSTPALQVGGSLKHGAGSLGSNPDPLDLRFAALASSSRIEKQRLGKLAGGRALLRHGAPCSGRHEVLPEQPRAAALAPRSGVAADSPLKANRKLTSELQPRRLPGLAASESATCKRQ